MDLMPSFWRRGRRPRGLNFLLGGIVAALVLIGAAILGDFIDLGFGGAPSVRIESSR